MQDVNKFIENFYLQVQGDEDFYKSLVKANEEYGNSEYKNSLRDKLLEEIVLPKALSLNYNVSLEDLINYEDEAFIFNKKMSENDIQNVTGGTENNRKILCLSFTLKNILK